jgi:uncharacterized protein (TIGR02217 family)
MVQVLADVVMPRMVVAGGITGRQIRRNARAESASGFVSVNVVRSRTRRQYDLGTVPRAVTAWQAIEALYEVTEAGGFGFLLEDPKDSDATADTGRVIQVAGVWQLHKRYQVAGGLRYRDRRITRPMGAVRLLVGGVEVAGTVDPDTGIVVYASAPPDDAVLAWVGRFRVPVHFASDDLEWDVVSSGEYLRRLVLAQSIILDEILE